MKKHNCYACVHREKLIGDAHSKCNYPSTVSEIPKKTVDVDSHGWAMGWANWPHNFDPTWIKKCKAYQEK